ncbi:hypothetical protein RFI_07345 [Reticulomyxa filosa]|uniref:Uncharacterized protein n=1 Tax=Reticulomyxa filosa TaxID=46433 RepID=X6NUT2_RETFI|nr:hypothetical protein RFI_07345 [Reticulomyxa filosa]|eukprot:ETO29776.1 hypothetical protein RFI_07345 [Reticulomyxa filosa]
MKEKVIHHIFKFNQVKLFTLSFNYIKCPYKNVAAQLLLRHLNVLFLIINKLNLVEEKDTINSLPLKLQIKMEITFFFFFSSVKFAKKFKGNKNMEINAHYYNEQRGDGPKFILVILLLEILSLIVLACFGIWNMHALFGAAVFHFFVYCGFRVLVIAHKAESEPYLDVRFGPCNLKCFGQSKQIYYSDIEYFTIIPYNAWCDIYGVRIRRWGSLLYSNPKYRCCSSQIPHVVFAFHMKSTSRLRYGLCCGRVNEFLLVTDDLYNLKNHLIEECDVTFRDNSRTGEIREML